MRLGVGVVVVVVDILGDKNVDGVGVVMRGSLIEVGICCWRRFIFRELR